MDIEEQFGILIKKFLEERNEQAKTFPVADVSWLASAINNAYLFDGKVFTFGNGGGANIAEHFASDLKIHPFVSSDKHLSTGDKRLEVHCLNESSGLITCLGNDMGYESIFVEQLKNYRIASYDVVVAFSVSGKSPNIIKALEYAEKKGATTSCIGKRFISDIPIVFTGSSSFPGQTGANDNYFHIEDFQSSVAHIVTGLMKGVRIGEIS